MKKTVMSLALISCFLLSGCSVDNGRAGLACEGFVRARIGATLESFGSYDATKSANGDWTVSGSYKASGKDFTYTCTTRAGNDPDNYDSWRLVSIDT